jgi:hypothetical protein
MIYTDGIHLVTDSEIEELHRFAKRLGFKRERFQDTRFPHYDILSDGKFKLAVDLGAKFVTSREIIKILTENK